MTTAENGIATETQRAQRIRTEERKSKEDWDEVALRGEIRWRGLRRESGVGPPQPKSARLRRRPLQLPRSRCIEPQRETEIVRMGMGGGQTRRIMTSVDLTRAAARSRSEERRVGKG